MIADIDKDGSGTIDFEEFLQMMTAKMGERDSKVCFASCRRTKPFLHLRSFSTVVLVPQCDVVIYPAGRDSEGLQAV